MTTVKRLLLTSAVLLLLSASGGNALVRASSRLPGPAGDAVPVAPAAGQTTMTLTARADAGVESPNPDAAHGELPYLPVYFLGTNEYARSLILFGLADVPEDAEVDTAVLKLYLGDASNPDPVGLTVKPITASWDERYVTWNTSPTTGNPTYTNLLVNGTLGYKSLDITAIVQAQLAGDNYGVEVSGPQTGPHYERVFESHEGDGSPPDYPPQLEITYHFPPGSWSNFSPADWVTTQTVTCSVQVQSEPGLASATYLYTSNGGSSWTGPIAASLSHVGSTWTITAAGVPFGQDSVAGSNRIQFNVEDTLGTPAGSTHYVYIDATPPTAPTSLGGSASTSTWLKAAAVTMSWSGAADGASGVQGYSHQWSTSAGTIPDAVMDTTALSAATSIPGEGSSWYFHVRTVDNAGNWSTGAAHVGPFLLDTTLPTNPSSLSSTTHSANVWSGNNVVTCQWSGASDNLSSVAGYSYAWDHSATTVPDGTVDTASTSSTSAALDDDDDWYFHVRTVDHAGNAASGASHIGPFKIDTWRPDSWVLALNPTQETTQFQVTWEGFAGSGSPVASYDIQVTDYSNLTAGTTQWLTATTAPAATFTTGQRGHTYCFSARARDAAGNLESYPSTADSCTDVGRSSEVLVQDQWGSPRVGAKVYHHGEYAGLTDAQGKLTLDDALVGDAVIALYQVFEHTSPKALHGKDGSSNWNWRVYQTNIAYSAAGDPQPHAIAHTSLTQQITVYPTRPLIGFHLVVSVQWDASPTYLQALRYGLRNASDFLYDVTDGQMFWEVIEVFDNEARQSVCDMFVVAPSGRAHAGVGEIEASTGRMVLYRPFVTMNVSGGNPGLEGGARTMIHEFGHYGLHLWDEYRDRNGAEGTGAYCASNFDTHKGQAYAASIMNNQGVTSELCSRVDTNHQHMAATQHDAVTKGESTWETVLRYYNSATWSTLWTLESPDTRGAVMDGPTAVPAPAWTTIYVTDVDTGACPPFTVTATSLIDGAAMPGVTVYVVYQSSSGADTGLTWLPQGATDSAGNKLIVGAHNGDLIVAVTSGNLGLLEVSGCTAVDLSTSSVAASGDGTVAAQLVMQPEPFALGLTVVPLDGSTIQVQVEPSVPLAAAPQVAAWQEGVADSTPVGLAYDADTGRYTGQAALDPSLGPRGYVVAYGRDTANQEVWAYQPYDLSSVTPGEWADLYSTDGEFSLVLLPGSLTDDALVTILQNVDAGPPPEGLLPVGPTYRALMLDGAAGLAGNATVNVHYAAESASLVEPTTVRLYHWNGSEWTAVVGGRHSVADQVASASVDELGIYALFGNPLTEQGRLTYLPVLSR